MRSVEFLFVGNGMVFVSFCADSSGFGNRILPDFLSSGACFLINVKTYPLSEGLWRGWGGNLLPENGDFFLGKRQDISWKTPGHSVENLSAFHGKRPDVSFYG